MFGTTLHGSKATPNRIGAPLVSSYFYPCFFSFLLIVSFLIGESKTTDISLKNYLIFDPMFIDILGVARAALQTVLG